MSGSHTMQSDNEGSENTDSNSDSGALKQLLKSNQRTGIFTCNLESCNRYYQSENAFKKNLRKKHSALLSTNDHTDDAESNIENFQNVLVDQNQIDDDSVVFEPINEPLKADEDVLGGLKVTALFFFLICTPILALIEKLQNIYFKT